MIENYTKTKSFQIICFDEKQFYDMILSEISLDCII